MCSCRERNGCKTYKTFITIDTPMSDATSKLVFQEEYVYAWEAPEDSVADAEAEALVRLDFFEVVEVTKVVATEEPAAVAEVMAAADPDKAVMAVSAATLLTSEAKAPNWLSVAVAAASAATLLTSEDWTLAQVSASMAAVAAASWEAAAAVAAAFSEASMADC